MFCKRCGSALPSHGFICKNCGAMMDSEQIKNQKEYMKNNNIDNINVNHDYKKRKENKYLGAIFIILIIIILIILVIIKMR